MSCESMSKLIPLYYYGELPPEDEERVEEHLHACAGCAREMEAQRALAAALDRRQVEIPPGLLGECRAGLLAALDSGLPVERPVRKSIRTLLLEAAGGAFAGLTRLRQPVGAVALVAVGFFAARFTGTSPTLAPVADTPSDQVFASVRSIVPDNSGRVRIAFDETRRRMVSGSMDSPDIQRLLLAAAQEENPAVRVEAVGLFNAQAGSAEVRDALLNALAHDPNPGVRLKAIEGLKALAGDAEIRKALARALATDDYPAVRMQAVDLLVAHRDGSMVGVLQEVVQSENNDYVRLKCERALKDMNASIGTF